MKTIPTRIGKAWAWALAHPVFTTTLLIIACLEVIGWTAPSPAYALQPGVADPSGFGDLFDGPDLLAGDAPTLYEKYPDSAYTFSRWFGTVGPEDFAPYAMWGICNTLLYLLMGIVRGTIVIVQNLATFTGYSTVATGISDTMGYTATQLVAWLLPSAMALGAVIAFAMYRAGNGGVLTQLLWIVIAGVVAVTMSTNAAAWVQATTGLKEIGTNSIAGASASAVSSIDIPFKGSANPTFSGSEQNKMLRQISDASWRALVVTPWCIANFGSMDACKQWGSDYLDNTGTHSPADIETWVENTISDNGIAEDSSMGTYLIGHSSGGMRLGVMLFALLVALIFAILVAYLSIVVIISLGAALLLLVVGALFVMLWCIPGRPRQWGINWLEELFGLIIQSVLAIVILMATLVVMAAAYGQIGTIGWGGGVVITIGVLLAAFGLRGTISRIMGVRGAGGTAGAFAMIAGGRMIRSRARNLRRNTGRALAAAKENRTGSPTGGKPGGMQAGSRFNQGASGKGMPRTFPQPSQNQPANAASGAVIAQNQAGGPNGGVTRSSIYRTPGTIGGTRTGSVASRGTTRGGARSYAPAGGRYAPASGAVSKNPGPSMRSRQRNVPAKSTHAKSAVSAVQKRQRVGSAALRNGPRKQRNVTVQGAVTHYERRGRRGRQMG